MKQACHPVRVIPFLDRLVGHLSRKAHLSVDGHGVHRRKTVQRWIAEHAQAIEMHNLPGYSPELNPDEILNADLKRAVFTNAAPANRHHPARRFPAGL